VVQPEYLREARRWLSERFGRQRLVE